MDLEAFNNLSRALKTATSKEKQRSKPDVSKVLQSARGAHYERRQATLQDSTGAASQLQRSDFARTAVEVRFEDCLSPAELQEWRAYTSTLEQLTHAGGSRPEASAALAALAVEQQAEPGPALPIRRMLASLEKRGSSKSLAPPPAAAAAAAAAKEALAPSPLPLGPTVSEAGPGSPTSSRPGVKFKAQPAEQAAQQAVDEDKAEQQPSRLKPSERRSLLPAADTSSSRRHSLAGSELACGPAGLSAPPYHRFSTSSLSHPSTTSTTSTTLKDRPINCISTSPHVPPSTSKGTGISPPQLALVEDTGTPLPSPLTSPSAPAALASHSGCSTASAPPHSLPGAQPPAGPSASSASSTRGAVTRIEQQSAAAHATFMRLVLGGGSSQAALSPLGRHSQASQVSLGHQRHSGPLPTVPAAAAAAAAAAGGEGASGLPPQHTAGAARLAAGSGQARSDAQKAGGGPAAAGPGAAMGGRGGGGGEGGGGGGMGGGGGGSGGHSTTSSSPSFRRSHTNSLPLASWLDPGPASDSRPGARAGGRGEGEGGAAGQGPGRSSGPEAQQPALSHMRRQPRRTASQLGRLLSDCLQTSPGPAGLCLPATTTTTTPITGCRRHHHPTAAAPTDQPHCCHSHPQAPPLSTTSTQGPDWASLGTILPCSPSSGVSSPLPLPPPDACPLLPLAAPPNRRPSCQVSGQGDSLDAFAAGQAAHSQPGYGLLNSSSSSRATAAGSCGGAGIPVGRQSPGSGRVVLGQGSGAGAIQGDCLAGVRAGRDSQAAAPLGRAGKAGAVQEQGQGQTPQQQQQQQQQPRQPAQAPVTCGYAALLRG